MEGVEKDIARACFLHYEKKDECLPHISLNSTLAGSVYTVQTYRWAD